jgi:hypothetical protein
MKKEAAKMKFELSIVLWVIALLAASGHCIHLNRQVLKQWYPNLEQLDYLYQLNRSGHI